MTIIELREKRNKAWEAAKAFVETKRDKDGLLSAEDAASYAEMEQKIKDYGAEIERMEQMAAMDVQLSKPTSIPLTAKPLNGDKPKSGRASDEYKAAMLNALRTNFRQVSDVLSEGVDANGEIVSIKIRPKQDSDKAYLACIISSLGGEKTA